MWRCGPEHIQGPRCTGSRHRREQESAQDGEKRTGEETRLEKERKRSPVHSGAGTHTQEHTYTHTHTHTPFKGKGVIIS